MTRHRLLTAFSLVCVAFAAPFAIRAKEKSAPAAPAETLPADPEAQYQLAQAYLRGIGVPKDPAKAYELVKMAAAQGHADAIGGLGYFPASGIMVKKDLAEAAECFRKGAEKGSARAQVNYGLALVNGRGVPANAAEGLKWIEKSASQGQPHAFYVQGLFFYHGTAGQAQDYAKAFALFQKAAESDLAGAENILGVMHEQGLGVSIDLAQAEAWYRKAAEQGEAKAMSSLGQLLGPDGPDASKHVEAMKWLLLAHRANDASARQVLNEILRTRPEDVMTEARKQMAEFKLRAPNEAKR